MELRSYQKEQLNFLKSLKNRKVLQSPTGTGKSIVLLEYIKEVRGDYNTIVLSTGFNNLVFQMYSDAKEIIGNDIQMVIGSNHLVPNRDGKIVYSTTVGDDCSDCDKSRCVKCAKDAVYDYLLRRKKIVITNHSYLISHLNTINPDLVILDEAHTFPEFYRSSMQTEISGIFFDEIRRYMTLNNPMSFTFCKTYKTGCPDRIIPVVFDDIIKNAKTAFSKTEMLELKREFKSVFTESKNTLFVEDESSFKRYNYFNRIKLESRGKSPDIVLSSATIDKYTMKMFGINKHEMYVQRLPDDRYINSKFISCHYDYKDKIREVFESEFIGKKGLILCTSNASVDYTVKELNGITEITRDLSTFAGMETGVLVGSKALFQGINIRDLEFVILDKLPFDIYDKNFQTYCKFIKNTAKIDPWTEYTVPLMENSLLQALGRLWRKNDIENNIYDDGTICIFDTRLGDKMNFVEKFVCSCKPNIQFEVKE